jgi:hypothetical protein
MEIIQIISVFFSLLFLIVVFRLILKKQLKEEFSIIWILCAIVLNIFAFWKNGIDFLASLLGVYYAPSLLFIFLFAALICYCLHLSKIISKQHNDIKNLTQQMAILESRINNNSL